VDVVGESGGGGVAVPTHLALTDTNSAGYEAGLAYYPTPVPGAGVTATFDALLENGTGADGLTFALVNAASGKPVLGGYGGGLGFSGTVVSPSRSTRTRTRRTLRPTSSA